MHIDKTSNTAEKWSYLKNQEVNYIKLSTFLVKISLLCIKKKILFRAKTEHKEEREATFLHSEELQSDTERVGVLLGNLTGGSRQRAEIRRLIVLDLEQDHRRGYHQRRRHQHDQPPDPPLPLRRPHSGSLIPRIWWKKEDDEVIGFRIRPAQDGGGSDPSPRCPPSLYLVSWFSWRL